MNKYWKIAIGILFALAAALGIVQHARDPYAERGVAPGGLTRLPASGDTLEDYYRASQAALPQEPQRQTATFLAAGDIMLSRNVAGTIQKANNADLPFTNMADILKSTDFNFANLESPISGSSSFNPSGSLVFNAPEAYAAGLKDYNFQILNLANNHAFDQGLAGLLHTRTYLDSLGIRHIGTGNNLDEAWQPAAVQAGGLDICFAGASYSSVNDSGSAKNDYVARIEDTQRLKSQIQGLRPLCDFIVATMHAGAEYTRQPNRAQTDFARAAIDDGADMVIGAHPHWVQTIEQYRGKYIFYSLGNFIFDQMWSQDTKEGLTLKIQISKPKIQNENELQGTRLPAQLDSVELIPVIIENYSAPRPANPDEAKSILEKIGQTQTVLK